MTREEELELCLKMGVREDWAEDLLSRLSGKNGSALPMLRLLRSFSDYLQFYKGGYAELLKKRQEQGGLSLPEKKLIEKGAAPEDIQRFAYWQAYEAIECVMELLGSQGGEPEMFKNEAFSECGRVGIVELDPDRKPTGKYVIYPFGDDFTRWFKNDE